MMIEVFSKYALRRYIFENEKGKTIIDWLLLRVKT